MLKTNVSQLARRYRKRGREVARAQKAAMTETLNDAHARAVRASGAKSYDPKTNRTRPYARRVPHPPLPPFLLNVQSGRLIRSWKVRFRSDGRRFTGTLYNTAPYAAAMTADGTREMIGRPILETVRAEVLPAHRRRMRDAQKKSLKQT